MSLVQTLEIDVMIIFRYFFIVLFMSSLFSNVNAGNRENEYYRSFWSPTYLGQRLDYCTDDQKECGLPLATRYCQMMGYKRADYQVVDLNIGLTHYLLSYKSCKGWHCNGFMMIRCMSEMTHELEPSYSYRAKEFVFPRFNQHRVAWCYDDGKGCGKRAASSFCRRMGYMRAQHYKIDHHVSQTRALGNHRLCLGRDCDAFSSITCYR